jgi:glutathione S-transferase
MILYGQYDSPFVRRVAVALHHHAMTYDHNTWSVWSQASELAAINPLRRVPVVVLDDGETLIESAAILDAIDELALAQGRSAALVAARGSARRAVLQSCARATGVADKAASLLREHRIRNPEQRSPFWIERCTAQVRDTLDALERELRAATGEFWFGALSHADIALACTLRFMREAHPSLTDDAARPALAAHAARCEALPIFAAVVQPLDF